MNKERLLKLAEHLEKGKLGHKVFNFAAWNKTFIYEEFDERGCGTMGCAIGECPVLWPEDWMFSPQGERLPILRKVQWNINLGKIQSSIVDWFDLEINEMTHLFFPGQQTPSLYGGKGLWAESTKEEVAANIRALVQVMELNLKNNKQ